MQMKDNKRILVLILVAAAGLLVLWLAMTTEQKASQVDTTARVPQETENPTPQDEESPRLLVPQETLSIPVSAPTPEGTATRIFLPTVVRPSGNVTTGNPLRSFYVATNGSDSNPGTLSRPWRTISKAGRTLQAGDAVFVRGGVYNEKVAITVSGKDGAPVVITSYPGEMAIIDGNNYAIPGTNNDALINVYGAWVTVRSMEIRKSSGLGILVSGANSSVDDLDVHDNWGAGVVLKANYTLAENSRVWSNSLENYNGRMTGSWGTGISCARYPDHCTIRGNVVWGTWGEGISTFESMRVVIEDNISYNNMQNFYLSDTRYTIMRRNLSYCTPGNPIDVVATQNGILIGDEKGVPNPLNSGGSRSPSSDNQIINNLVMGCNRNLAAGTKESSNSLYAYNTFVNAGGSSTELSNVLFYEGTANNARFMNNIIVQDNGVDIDSISGSGIAFAHNLWSRTPASTRARGAGDVIGNPLLTKNGSTAAGQLSGEWFKLLSSSPARGKAYVLAEVIDDFFHTNRGSTPTIGAYQLP